MSSFERNGHKLRNPKDQPHKTFPHHTGATPVTKNVSHPIVILPFQYRYTPLAYY